MIAFAQDESMEELRETAKSSMTDEERHRRLAQLQAKRYKLDMSLQGMDPSLSNSCMILYRLDMY